MRAHNRPRIVQQPECTRQEMNNSMLDTAFPMQQFRRSEWPQGTVTFCQSQSLLRDYEWRRVDTTNIGASQVFRPGEVQSWYVNARVRFYVVFLQTPRGVEAPLSPYSAPHSRCPGVSILPTITPLESLILYTLSSFFSLRPSDCLSSCFYSFSDGAQFFAFSCHISMCYV